MYLTSKPGAESTGTYDGGAQPLGTVSSLYLHKRRRRYCSTSLYPCLVYYPILMAKSAVFWQSKVSSMERTIVGAIIGIVIAAMTHTSTTTAVSVNIYEMLCYILEWDASFD